MLAAVGDELVVLVQGTVGHAAMEVIGAETLLKSQGYYLYYLNFDKIQHIVWYAYLNAASDESSGLPAVDAGQLLRPLDLADDLCLGGRRGGLEEAGGEPEAEEVDLEAGQQGTQPASRRVPAQKTHCINDNLKLIKFPNQDIFKMIRI